MRSHASLRGGHRIHVDPRWLRRSALCYSVPGNELWRAKMDSMNGQHGNGGTRDSQAAVLSVLLSILASKRVVLDRQHGCNGLGHGLGNPTDSAI